MTAGLPRFCCHTFAPFLVLGYRSCEANSRFRLSPFGDGFFAFAHGDCIESRIGLQEFRGSGGGTRSAEQNVSPGAAALISSAAPMTTGSISTKQEIITTDAWTRRDSTIATGSKAFAVGKSW
jgi:hypothetical protein